MGKCKHWEKIKNDPIKVEEYRARKRRSAAKRKEQPGTVEKLRANNKKHRDSWSTEKRQSKHLAIAENFRKRMEDPEYAKLESEKRYAHKKHKLATDPMFRMKENMRRRTNNFFKASDLIKENDFNGYIGCLPSELRSHIEKQFTEGMSFENYGKWEIDHIIPLASAKTQEDMYKLLHYTNLQPLWSNDNCSKGAKIPSK